MDSTEKKVYTIGIKINSNEDYDRLKKDFSRKGLFGLDFEELDQGYPADYPCLVQYLVDYNLFSMIYAMQLKEIIDGGYKVQLVIGDD